MKHIVLVARDGRAHALWRTPIERLGPEHTVRVVVSSEQAAEAWGRLAVHVVSPPAGARRVLDRLMRPSLAAQARRDPVLTSDLSSADLVLVDEDAGRPSALRADALGPADGKRVLARLLVDQTIESGGTPFAPREVLEVERQSLGADASR